MIVCLQPLFGSSENKTKKVRTFDPLVNDDDVCRNYLAVEQNTVGKKVFCLFKVHFYTQCSRQNVFSYVLVLHPLNELVLSGKSWVRPEVCGEIRRDFLYYGKT